MAKNRDIKEAVQKLAGTWNTNPLTVIVAKIVSVNDDEMTCTIDPLNDNSTVTIENVNLSAQPNDGFVCYPSVDSIVLVAYAPKLDPFILQFSDIDKCRITIEKCEYYIDKDGIKLHGDNFGGLVKVSDLVNKINRLEIFCNTHIHPVTAVGSPTGVAVAPITPPTTIFDLENTKVLHGNI